MSYRSNLEQTLAARTFAVTAEIGPPKGCNQEIIKKKAEIVRESAHAFNVTDNQTAVVRLSSLAGSRILLNMGLEPILQMSCRDRNRIGLQSDILGAAALGIRNVLCITGDHQLMGNHPQARGVFDVDSIQLLQIIATMRDEGKFQSGDEIVSGRPTVFLGAAANPFADPFEYRVDRLEKKIEAGAAFIQTQSVYNIEKFGTWLDEVTSRGLDTKVHILAGITPLKSFKMAERMKFHVPGVDLPDNLYKRMKQAQDPLTEGYQIALELIQEVKQLKGIHGIHFTALFWEEIIPHLVKEAKVMNQTY